MQALGFRSDLLRPASGEDADRVTYVELFFDLVFVFAVTQISHILIEHPSADALLHSVMLTLVVWWVWVYTTWVASWLNPQTAIVRTLFLVLMLLGILLASAIPEAFGDKALLFAITLVVMQLGRSSFTIFAFARRSPAHAMNFVRIALWHAATGVLWIVGALAPAEARIWIWLAALVLDYIGPRIRFWFPGFGASSIDTWNVSGKHMSERVSLFLIIALGESIIVTGTSFASGALDWTKLFAFLAAFVGTVLMWFLYFNHGERGGSEYLVHARTRGLVAQVAFTYVPVLLVAGIVFAAVGDGMVLHHPDGSTSLWTAGLLCGSSALYLIGNALFKRAVGWDWPVASLAGAVALVIGFVVAALFATALSPVTLSWIVNAVLLAVVIADEVTFRRAGVAQAS